MLSWIVLASIAGYGWFVLRTPTKNFDTIKPTYVLQIFPMLCV